MDSSGSETGGASASGAGSLTSAGSEPGGGYETRGERSSGSGSERDDDVDWAGGGVACGKVGVVGWSGPGVVARSLVLVRPMEPGGAESTEKAGPDAPSARGGAGCACS